MQTEYLLNSIFHFTLGFTEEYPNKPPTVRFVSKMFHPNVYADGGKQFYISSYYQLCFIEYYHQRLKTLLVC